VEKATKYWITTCAVLHNLKSRGFACAPSIETSQRVSQVQRSQDVSLFGIGMFVVLAIMVAVCVITGVAFERNEHERKRNEIKE
jgi:hypothetical protein